MNTKEWDIRVMDPSPYMTSTRHKFTGTYAEACEEARAAHNRTGRLASVWTGMSQWFRVNGDGETNFNTGAPTL